MGARLLWRTTRKDRADTAFTGTGAARHPGRWNSRGTRIVYTSESLAAATLEAQVHLEDYRLLQGMVYFRIRISGEAIAELDPSELPDDWDNPVPSSSTQQIGAVSCNDQSSVGLRVPSVIVPETYNVLLNPEHPGFADVEIGVNRQKTPGIRQSFTKKLIF